MGYGMTERLRITITGIVQGVGFRPFVYNLALRLGITGWVLNDSGGVVLEAEGEAPALEDFVVRLKTEAPPLAMIADLVVQTCSPIQSQSFIIRHSDEQTARTALVSPDVAVCDDCLREMGSPADRRYRYPFINCTNCGPRYTIIRDVPYDRPKTTMASFSMCQDCQKEYNDPSNRRFHAQPNACSCCGPVYRLVDSEGCDQPGDAVAAVKHYIGQGFIVAIKGIGGYHLACDSRNERAVSLLRSRKIREDKPFAIMAGSMDTVRQLCHASAAEEEILTSLARPIVLLEKRAEYDLAPNIAPGNPFIGVMLPYAPIHPLLLDGHEAWVMTSGNTSDEPIIYDDEEALHRLRSIADYFLIHNRPIYRRADDSVVRIFRSQPYVIRRSRGYVPLPIELSAELPPVVAAGAEVKNTFCLTKGKKAFLGPHIGDLENLSTFESYQQAITHWQQLFDITPQIVAYDLHPEYLSTKFALTLGLPAIGVQHHHAHIAAVMAEHGLSDPVIGVAFDGTGYGTDGTLWGGEFLAADLTGFERLAYCQPLPLPGGAQAIREPWRMAAWILYKLYGDQLWNLDIPCIKQWPPYWQLPIQAAVANINSPLTSSAGRLFDAAAAIIGCRQTIHYEGQAAVELELLSGGKKGKPLPFDIKESTPAVIDFMPAFASLVTEMRSGKDASSLAASFHSTIAQGIVSIVSMLGRQTGMKQVALSGGVFQNLTLLNQVVPMLEQQSFTIYWHRRVPPNDGGVALGQAIIAGTRSR